MPGYHWLPDRLKVRAQARRGRADALRLRGDLPALTESESAPSTIVPNIGGRHAEYILATGTNRDMAASVELCRFLVQYCAAHPPERIADLGSGITSCTLRTWRDAQCPSCSVISVDDNPDWLKRSREFSAAARAPALMGSSPGSSFWTARRRGRNSISSCTTSAVSEIELP